MTIEQLPLPGITPGVRWRTDVRGPYIRKMPTGRKVYLLNPTLEAYDVREIAYHAAGINRYTGGSRISIAQHMCVGAAMAEMFYPEERDLPARVAIHDIAETNLGDVSSPLKSLLGDAFRDLEDAHDRVVERKFGVTFRGVKLVKEVDDRMWLTEREWLHRDCTPAAIEAMKEDVAAVPLEPFSLPKQLMSKLFSPWGADFAEMAYLDCLAWHFKPGGPA